MKIAGAMCFVTLMLSGVTLGKPVTPQKVSVEQSLSHEIRCVLGVEERTWTRKGPTVIHIQLENLRGRSLDFVTTPTLYLTNQQVSYWAPTDITQNKALDIRQHVFGGGSAVSIKPVPLKVHLNEYSKAEFVVDAAKTKWDREISSVWPSLSLSALLPGTYSLRLDLSDAAGNLVRSNQVKVSLK